MRAFRVTVSESDEELASALLWEADTAGIEVETAPEGCSVLLAYFAGPVALQRLREALPDATVEAVPVPDVDWVARFRESFRAFRVGRFVVAPPWDRPPPLEEGVLLVDPGRAFGTGTHESTRLCLHALEDIARRRALGRVADIGTGTGILAVAAARLGAELVVASDNDPEATSAARHHAALNEVRVHVVRGDGAGPLRPGEFDVVVANLTTPLLVAAAGRLAALRRPEGSLVMSGLLEDDIEEVQASYSAFGQAEIRRQGEWVALLYRGVR